MLVAALLIAYQTGTNDPVIDFVSPPARLVNILPKLSEATGKALECAPETRDELLVISVKGATSRDLLQKVADVCSASWQPTRTGLRLVRSRDMAKREVDEEFKEETKLWAEALAGFREHLRQRNPVAPETIATFLDDVDRHNRRKLGDSDQERFDKEQDMFNLASRTPLVTLQQQLVSAFTPELVARLTSEYGETYSNAPTPMEKPFPREWNEVLASFERTQAAFASAARSRGTEPVLSDPHFPIDLSVFAVKAEKPRCIVQLLPLGTVCNVYVSLIGRDGAVLPRPFSNAGLTSQPLIRRDPVYQSIGGIPIPKQPLVLSDLAGEIQQIHGPWYIGQQMVSDRLLETLLRPERDDPAALGRADAFLSYSSVMKCNVVVRLVDEAEPPSITGESGQLAADEWLKSYRKVLAFTYRSGWLVGKPIRPAMNRSQQIDRDKLGVAYRKAWAAHKVSLDEAAEFFASQPVAAKPELWLRRFSHLVGLKGVGSTVNKPLVRFYGSLPSSKRQTVWKEGVPIEDLSDVQKGHLDWAVYGSSTSLRWFGGWPSPTYPKSLPAETLDRRLLPVALLRGTVIANPAYPMTRLELWVDGYRAMVEELPHGLP